MNVSDRTIICTQCVKNIRMLSLAYGMVCVNNPVTYITNEVLTLRHNCVSVLFACNLQTPKRLANCKLYTNYCSARPYKTFPSGTLFCSKKPHHMYWDLQCCCKLCVKDKLRVSSHNVLISCGNC
jgi:hypothetical protein